VVRAAGPALRVVGAAVVDDLVRPTLLLAARRTGPPALAGGWELPGGKVEPGEEPVPALHRELREELGIGVELGAELLAAGPAGDDPWGTAWPVPLLRGHPATSQLGRSGGRLRVWLAAVREGEATARDDHDAVRWLGREEWLSVPWLAVDLPVVHHLDALAPRR
jgi:8-oxo-dGTP diphosphatase